ncbi:MAG: D-glycero-beta-D-manno-heptose 1-phosphate adenylyltransferase [Candidatus Firestonebacteria bacterium]
MKSKTLSKLKLLDKLKKIIGFERQKGKKVVFTNGCFDLLHIGHIRYLKAAKKLADILIVAINSDSSIKKIKGELRPVYPEKERAEILSAFSFVDYIVIFAESDPIKVVSELKPDVLIKGGDWSIDKVLGKDIVESYGGKVMTIPMIKGYSTTNLIKKIVKLEGYGTRNNQ